MSFGLLSLAALAQLAGTGAAIALGIGFFLAGFAHGAAEHQSGTLRAFRLLDAAAYVLAGLAVAALFLAMPLAGLTLFLLLSAWHFQHSAGGDRLARWAYALTAVGGSALWQGEATAEIFAALLGQPIPQPWMLVLAVAGGAGLVLAIAALGRRPHGWSLIACVAATALLHPVLATGLAFFLGHAWPMQHAQARRFGWSEVIRAAAPTAIPAMLGALAIAAFVLVGILPLVWAAALAFGMATPHILTERLER
ncbi:Brp/Blh family beta-carotene 15,15'-dioxygenase [Paraurantiacibacter namhicola]|uniref:Brp/Blh family beta-carotene 15,15'-dioxygenase n=1 Tax=Paraurantiacibacter namhicola TaxID=645517 RepID=UPI00082D4AAE|nr:Brp/Blh family beta-carotene 15,15'-dioxygenase [Paraurantiacibacter namhicola]